MAQAFASSNSLFHQAAHVEQSYCKGGVALWDTQQDAYYHLNDTGAEIWQHLDRPSSVSALVRKLANDFDATPSTIVDCVESLLRELVGNGLVCRSSE